MSGTSRSPTQPVTAADHTAGATMRAGQAPETYEDHRRCLLAANLTPAMWVAFAAILLSMLIVLRVRPSPPWGLVVPFLIQLVVPLAALVLFQGPLQEHPLWVAMAADVALTVSITGQLLLRYATTSDVALALSLKMLATALFLPWGAKAQYASATVSVVLHVSLLALSKRTVPGVGFPHTVIGPVVAGLLSAAGAANLDAARRKIFRRDAELERSEKHLRALLASVREGEARKGAILGSVLDPIFMVDGRGKILEMNPAAEVAFGRTREAALDRPIADFLRPTPGCHEAWSAAPGLAEALLGRRVERLAVRADGDEFPVEMTVTKVDREGSAMFTVYTRDLTERRRAEDLARQQQAELAHALRVATIGEMAAELAHELNQPLSAIVNFARGLITRLGGGGAPDSEARQVAAQIAAEALRAAEVIRRQRSFVRRSEPKREPCDVNGLARDAAHLVEPDARGSAIRVRLALDRSLPRLWIDRVQIEQVILNLLRNGLESIQEAGQGENELLVETAVSNGFVEIRVSDTGLGLRRSEQEMFAPFFTTKPGGLGLGLSICRSIVEAHGGRLWTKANHDCGATVGFGLPVSLAESPQPPTPDA